MEEVVPLAVGCKGVVCLVSQGGAILLELVVALWDVHVPVAVQPDSVV